MDTEQQKPFDTKRAEQFFADKITFTTGPVEVHTLIRKKTEDVNIIDVRAKKDYEKAHIPGAKNLPQEEWETAAGLETNKKNIIYCYAQTCHLAAKAARQFASRGHPVMELDGGFADWQEHHFPTESRKPDSKTNHATAVSQ